MSVIGAPVAPAWRDADHTHAPAARRGDNARAVVIWLGLIGYVAAAKLVLDAFLPHAFAVPAQAFSWQAIVISAATGVAGVWFARATGFSPAWTPRIGAVRQLVLPSLVGFGLASVMVAFDLATGTSRAINAVLGVTQQFTDAPSMLLIFSAAAIYVEPLYRLLLIPLPLWLISNLLLRGRHQQAVFWVLAVLASAFEPLLQVSAIAPVLGPTTTAALAGQAFVTNLTQAAYFRRYGFVAAIAVREGYYLLWHVLYVH